MVLVKILTKGILVNSYAPFSFRLEKAQRFVVVTLVNNICRREVKK